MPFHLKHSDASVERALRRIATSQIDAALAEIADPALDDQTRIHQLRKRAKKLRGLLRLVRPAFADYRMENAAFRDAASKLSPARDADVMIATYDGLIKSGVGETDRARFAPLRERLLGRKQALVAGADLAGALGDFQDALRAARTRVAHWTLDRQGFDAVEGGLVRSYRSGRKALKAAARNATPEHLHEWRKRVKDHWYHARLLRAIAPEFLDARRKAARHLAGMLGDLHDLAVLRAAAQAEAGCFAGAQDLNAFLTLIDDRAAALETEAFALGHRMFADKPSALRKRWAEYWKAWREA